MAGSPPVRPGAGQPDEQREWVLTSPYGYQDGDEKEMLVVCGPFVKSGERVVPRSQLELALSRIGELEGVLAPLVGWAQEVRAHYGIEQCAGPGQPATEWDAIQDGLRDAAEDARAALRTEEGKP